jgi:hypothetical protein
VLGFKASDWVGDRAGFFRAANRYHHSLVLIRSERAAFNHFCIRVESLDDVMGARHNAVKAGVKLGDDLLRHAPSGSIGFYMKDEARGYAVEFCVGHPSSTMRNTGPVSCRRFPRRSAPGPRSSPTGLPRCQATLVRVSPGCLAALR